MRLVDHMTQSGRVLFRGRSFIPLVLVPLLIIPFRMSRTGELPLAWELLAGGVAISGEVLRFLVAGRVAPGTSERSTTSARAESLSTTGAYSLVRHPLYVANTLTMVGLSLFPGLWYLPVIVIIASVLYYERIAIHEESFLESRFGEDFRRWSRRVPAVVPRISRYVPTTQKFSWRQALEREFNGILAIAVSLFVLDLVDDSPNIRTLRVNAVWTAMLVGASVTFVAMVVRKRIARRRLA